MDPETNGNLFFWHFQNRHIANRQRTLIWLNGGPGCSSMDGALMEVGPYRLKDDQTLEYNEGSWDEFANMLFVDQPVGTGFSYVNTDSYLHELDEMSAQFVTFLEKWFEIFPEYARDDVGCSLLPSCLMRSPNLNCRSISQVNLMPVNTYPTSPKPSKHEIRMWTALPNGISAAF